MVTRGVFEGDRCIVFLQASGPDFICGELPERLPLDRDGPLLAITPCHRIVTGYSTPNLQVEELSSGHTRSRGSTSASRSTRGMLYRAMTAFRRYVRYDLSTRE